MCESVRDDQVGLVGKRVDSREENREEDDGDEETPSSAKAIGANEERRW